MPLLWNLAERKEKAVLRGQRDAPVTAVFSADGSKIVTASEDNTTRIWDSSTGEVFAVFRGHVSLSTCTGPTLILSFGPTSS
jgi:WD40 repeat protein